MTDHSPSAPTESSSLDPAAPAFTMASDPKTSETFPTGGQDTGPLVNGQAKDPKQPKQKRPEAKSGSTETNIAEAGAGVKLTGAQLKKQRAAEKAARRADKVTERGAQIQAEQSQSTAQGSNESKSTQKLPANRKEGSGHQREGSTAARQLPVRPGPGGQRPQQQQSQIPPQEKQLDKRVPMLTHLYPSKTSERATIASAGRDIHPAVLTLGLQLRDYVICGANARTVATLLVFKKVIRSYTTPPGTALSRNLTKHLSDQITYLSHARFLSVAQGNSIRWLKKLISALDPDLAENEAKTFLCQTIDQYIREKVTLADEVIAREAGERIESEGDVILTYGKSSVVEKTLLTAWENGKRFKVVVVDSRPLFEGKNLAKSLIQAGLQDVRYCLLNGLGDVMQNEGITKCFLGASAMLGNGRLSSRSGTAMVAMMAKEGGPCPPRGRGKVPVMVLCESVKFTGRVAFDSLIMNEVADADVLVEHEESDTLTLEQSQQQQQAAAQEAPSSKKGSGGGKSNSDEKEEKKQQQKGLEGWKDQSNLYLVDLMYDVTPAEYLDMVISELGSLPPSAVPVVNGVHGGEE